MIILGIDPALNKLGFAVLKIENKKLFYVKSGVIENKKINKTEDKLTNIFSQIKQLILEEKISHLAIETSFSHINPSVGIKLGVVKGLIYAIAIENNVIIKEYTPLQIKKTITGKGSNDKSIVQNEISRLIPNITFKTNDESDAIAIAMTHAILF